MPTAISSPQSIIPDGRRTMQQLLEAAVQGQPSITILPPRLVLANGEAVKARSGVVLRTLQNCGTQAVKYLITNDPAVTDIGQDSFHGIMAGGSSIDDGLGTVINLSNMVARVIVKSTTGNPPRICVFEACVPKDV